MSEFCPSPDCGKKLDYDGESWKCRHCGFHDCMPSMGRQMTQPEVRELVRKARALPAPLSGSCLGRFHRKCAVSTCPCWCHSPEARQRYAAHLRREAAEVEHEGGPDAVERAEELRRRADEVAP